MDITEQLTHESRIALAAAAEITRLRARLEVRDDGGPDGILCRDESIRMQDAEITRLRAEVEALRADAERYRWLKGHSAYTTVTPCIHGEANGPSRMRWYHDSHQLHAFTLDAAIDAAIKSGLNSC